MSTAPFETETDNQRPSTRIMLVEDEGIVALDMEDRLCRLDFEVVAIADNGEDAIKFALQHRPDLILMDIRLKGIMTGIEAAETIRRDLDCPIVFMTAYSDSNTLRTRAPGRTLRLPCQACRRS